MTITPVLGGLALLLAAMGYVIRATLLSGRVSGWPSAPWWFRWPLWLLAGICAAQGASLLYRSQETVGRGELAVYVALAAYAVFGAANLMVQRSCAHAAPATAAAR